MENGIREILGNMDRIFTILQCEVMVLCLTVCNNLKQCYSDDIHSFIETIMGVMKNNF